MHELASWLRMTDPTRSWRDKYPEVALVIRQELATLAPEDRLASTALAKRVLPADAPAQVTRGFYSALRALADHELKDAWAPGPPARNGFSGKFTTPKLWHRVEGAPPEAEWTAAEDEPDDLYIPVAKLYPALEIYFMAAQPTLAQEDIAAYNRVLENLRVASLASPEATTS
jgi:hypothetical protein